MKIENNTIIFKANPAFYYIEEKGLKNNTVRKLDIIESMILEQNRPEINYIKIVNVVTKESFTRILTDISYYDYRYVFTWMVLDYETENNK